MNPQTNPVPFLSRKILFILTAIALLCISSLAHAQADRGGSGGSFTEGDLKHFLGRLLPYLQSPEGKQVFPEISEYDTSHPQETIEMIAAGINPRLTPNKVTDASGNERDCVSYFKPIRYFECSSQNLPPKPDDSAPDSKKSEYYGSLYRLVLHEVLVQAGLEHPLTVEVPSDYSISSRLMVHLENFPEWVPGGASINYSAQNDGAFHTHSEWSLGAFAGTYVGDLHYGLTLKEQFPVRINESEFRFGYSISFAEGTKTDDPVEVVRPWALQVLFTGEYDFRSRSLIKPYVGFGMGLAIVRSNYNDPITENTGLGDSTVGYVRYSATEADFVVGLNPGFRFGTQQQYFFETQVTATPHVGIGVFPTIGLRF